MRSEVEHRAQDRFVAGTPQRKVGDASRSWERIALRRETDPDGRTADDSAGEAAVFGDGQSLDADVSGSDGAEAPHIDDIVKADPFVADAGTERILCRGHGILTGALRPDWRRRGEQNRGNAYGP